MNERKNALVYVFLYIYTEGNGPWSSLGQEPSEPYIDKAIPTLWAVAQHVDDPRGNSDMLLDLLGETTYEKMADVDDPKLDEMDQRATEAWIAHNVALGIVKAMVGTITNEDEIEANAIDAFGEYVKTGIIPDTKR